MTITGDPASGSGVGRVGGSGAGRAGGETIDGEQPAPRSVRWGLVTALAALLVLAVAGGALYEPAPPEPLDVSARLVAADVETVDGVLVLPVEVRVSGGPPARVERASVSATPVVGDPTLSGSPTGIDPGGTAVLVVQVRPDCPALGAGLQVELRLDVSGPDGQFLPLVLDLAERRAVPLEVAELCGSAG